MREVERRPAPSRTASWVVAWIATLSLCTAFAVAVFGHPLQSVAAAAIVTAVATFVAAHGRDGE